MAMKQLKTRMFGGVRVACDVETGRVIGSRMARTSGLFLIPADGQVDNPPRLPVAEPAAARTGRSAVLWGTLSCSPLPQISANGLSDQDSRSMRCQPCAGIRPLAESGDPVAALPTAPTLETGLHPELAWPPSACLWLAVSAAISSPGHRPSYQPRAPHGVIPSPCHDPGRTLDVALRVTGCGMDRDR